MKSKLSFRLLVLVGGALSSATIAGNAAAIGESSCSTVDDLSCTPHKFCLHAPWDGPSSDGAAVAWQGGGDSFLSATSPSSTYGETGCVNAWITDIYGIEDESDQYIRQPFAAPATMPTTQVECELLVQEFSVYYHTTGEPWGTWTQLTTGSVNGVYQVGANWCAPDTCYPVGCTMEQLSNPGDVTLPSTGIDEVRIASLSVEFPNSPMQTVAGFTDLGQ
jgi:hypothetical protein